MKVIKTMLSLPVILIYLFIGFNGGPLLLAAEDEVTAYGAQEEAVSGDYIYKIISCSLKKQEAKTDNLFISLSARNAGPDNGPFPPISLVDSATKKEIPPGEKLPQLGAGASIVLNLNFAVDKNARYSLKVSGDKDGYLNAYLNLNADVSDPNNELLKAASEGDAKKIKELLKNGAKIETLNEKKETPLLLAAKCGSREAVKVLLDNKANIKAANLDDEHALYYAIDSGDYETVKLLLERGSNTYYTNYRGKTPLIAAKKAGDDKIIEIVQKYSDKGF